MTGDALGAPVHWWQRLLDRRVQPGGLRLALRRYSTARLLALTVVSVFLGETLVMLLLAPGGSASPLLNTVFDALFVSFLTVPALYYILVRPQKERIDKLATLQEELERSREAYHSLIDSTEDSIYLVDGAGRYQFVNRHHAARLGQPVDSLCGRLYGEFHTPEKSAEFAATIAGVIRTGASTRQEHWSHRDERWFLRTFSPVRDGSGATVAVTVVSKDITDLKQLEGQLQELSTTDALTGLRNRRGFDALAADRMKLAAREGHGVTLLFADLDELKRINDAFGHAAGDRVIRDAALLLTEACRGSDVVARVGGDEFVVLLSGAAAAGAERIIERIREVLERYRASGPVEVPLSLSIGVGSCAPGETCSVAELIARADQAMYASKAARKEPAAAARP